MYALFSIFEELIVLSASVLVGEYLVGLIYPLEDVSGIGMV